MDAELVPPSLSVSIAALVFALAAAPVGAATASPPAPDPDDALVVWGGTEHRTPNGLGSWLGARGAHYETWAERHPGAATRLEIEPAAAAPSEHVPLVGDDGVRARASIPVLLVIGPFAFGLALLGCAGLLASPWALALVRAPRLARALQRASFEVAGAGIVLVLAAAVGYVLAL